MIRQRARCNVSEWFNVSTSNTIWVYQCNVKEANATSVSDWYVNEPHCNINTILERQSIRVTSTHQYNVNTPLERQDINITPTRHATLAIYSKSINAASSCLFRFIVSRRTWDRLLRLKVGRISRVNFRTALVCEWNQRGYVLAFFRT